MCNINFRHLHIANNNLTRKTLFSVKSKVKILTKLIAIMVFYTNIDCKLCIAFSLICFCEELLFFNKTY